jgi:hypothetical protein
MMANLVLMLSKICMVSFSTLLMFLLIESDAALPTLGLVGVVRPRITSPTFPLFLVAFLSYVVATAYVDIFSATIKTIIFSHAADLELNGQLGNYVMSAEFQKFMGAAAGRFKSLHTEDEPAPADGDSAGGAAGSTSGER